MSKPVIPELHVAENALLGQMLEFARHRPKDELDEVRRRVERALHDAGPNAVTRLFGRILSTGTGWTYHAPDPLARDVQHALADVTLGQDSLLEHPERLDRIGSAPAVLLCNHLSYSDANLLEILLRRHGQGALSDRLTVVAGPKVYSDPVRRFSSLCFGTIKTPQSSALSTDEAVMTAREVARIARDAIAIARDRQAAGDALLVFVEGTRSRDAKMQRALPAVQRYFDAPGTLLVTLGITGSEKLVPVGDEHLHSGTVRIRVGSVVPARTLLDAAAGKGRLAMDAVGVAIARLLPESYRGDYAENSPGIEEARAISTAVFGSG
jgi:1-acyl-sn-glycerol-3-phosphate acyltransferase